MAVDCSISSQELQPKGRSVGDVHYSLLEMHGAAAVAGTLTHQHAGEPVLQLAAAEASGA